MECMEYHRDVVLTSLQQIQEDEAFTDLDVILSDGAVRSCRAIVASLSCVFHHMLSSNMRERNEGQLHLNLVSKDDWRCILSFYLSGRKLVTPDNVEDLLSIAHLYQLDALLEHCGSVLVDSLTADNCFHRLATSKMLMTSTTPKIMDFMKKNFNELIQESGFSSLAKEDILGLLGCCELVTTEDEICYAALKWLSERAAIEEDVREVLGLVKFNDLTVTPTFPLPPDQENSPLIERVMADLVPKQLRQRELSRGRHCTILPKRRSAKGGDVDIIMIGYDQDNTVRVLCTREGSQAWWELPSVQVGRGAAAHMTGDAIFVTGGEGTETAMYTFDIRNMTWCRGPDLADHRAHHAMTSIGNELYVLGGFHSGLYTGSIWKHSIGQGCWDKVEDFQVCAFKPGVAAIGNIIVVVGGTTGKTAIQTFNMVTGIHLCIKEALPCPMYQATGVSLGERAVFVGKKGDVVHMCCSDGVVSVVIHRHLAAFKFRRFFGLVIDGEHLFCLGDEPYEQRGFGISRYGLSDGHEDVRVLPKLPVLFDVVGAFATRVSVIGP